MTGSAIPVPTARQIERLLGSLAGIVSARVIVTSAGRPAEIHVLADPALHPKQVVRNVESALSAGMGLDIDRRVVSVAQAEPGAVAPASNGAGASAAPPEPAEPGPPVRAAEAEEEDRLVYVRLEMKAESNGRVRCAVTLRGPEGEHTGDGAGAATLQGRSEAAARALFAALAAARENEDVALEGVMLLDAHGRRYVLVAAHAMEGRDPAPLAGLAVLGRSAEEAAVLAALQAANRWATRGVS